MHWKNMQKKEKKVCGEEKNIQRKGGKKLLHANKISIANKTVQIGPRLNSMVSNS